MQQMLLTRCSTASIIHDADAADIDGVGTQMMQMQQKGQSYQLLVIMSGWDARGQFLCSPLKMLKLSWCSSSPVEKLW